MIPALSLIVAPVYADDLQDGLDAYNKKDYKTAFAKFKAMAGRGNAMAQVRLGWMYKAGLRSLQRLQKSDRVVPQGRGSGL